MALGDIIPVSFLIIFLIRVSTYIQYMSNCLSICLPTYIPTYLPTNTHTKTKQQQQTNKNNK